MTTSTPEPPRPPLGVGVVGLGWMGRVHSKAFSRVLHHYPDLPVAPYLRVVADPAPGRAAEAAGQYGFERSTEDWHSILDDAGLVAVSIATPNMLHREVGVAVAEAGKHVWIEKPVGVTADDARAVADAARANGVRSTVGFNYRYAPAVAAARDLIRTGRIGRPTHSRVRLFSDYAAHPDGALTWRYALEHGGHGVLGDLASHAVDLTRFLLGEIEELTCDTATFVAERPRPTAATSGHALAVGGEPGPVENEDYVAALLRMRSGARCTVEASRVAVGEQNTYGVEVHGTQGALWWDFRRMGELGTSLGEAYQDQSVSTVYVGPGAGEYAAFQPASSLPMSYDDLKVVEAYRFLRSVAGLDDLPGQPTATLDDAVRSAVVLDAMVESAQSGTWVRVEPPAG